MALSNDSLVMAYLRSGKGTLGLSGDALHNATHGNQKSRPEELYNLLPQDFISYASKFSGGSESDFLNYVNGMKSVTTSGGNTIWVAPEDYVSEKAEEKKQASGGISSSVNTPNTVNAYRAIVLPNGQEVNYDYADAQARAAADAGTYQVKTYGAEGGGKALPASTQSGTPALGTPEYTNYLVEQGKSLGMNLEQYRVPTTASGSTATPGVTLPSLNPTIGSVTDASAGTSGISQFLTTQMAELDKQRKNIESQQAESQSWLEKFLNEGDSPSEMREDAERMAGVDSAKFFADQTARVKEIEALTEQYNALVAAKDAQIAQSYGKLATTSFIDNQIGQINRNAAPELNRLATNVNAKAATLQALQGNFDRAQDYINQAVEYAMADKRDKLEAFSMMYEMNQDTLSRLDTQYQNAFNTAWDIAKMEYESDLQMKKTLAQLQLDNPQVSINLSGTLESAVAAIKANPKADGGQIIGSAETGYSMVYFDPTTNSYKTRAITGGTGGGVTPGGVSEVDTYAQSYLDEQIDITSVPQNLRAQVLQRANEIALAAATQSQTQTSTPAYVAPNQTIYNASRAFGQDLKPLVSGPSALIKGGYDAASSFFSGLFGR